MTERASFLRKIGYGIAIAVLAVAMMWLSAPATTNSDGGKLAELRTEYGLAQVNLGDVDPASETIKLATLGLRGVAVIVLWEKANNYKKKEDWTNLTATLEQLAKLQPNFITFWKFQAWNLTYNVSVEFDAVKDRYYYVRRGIEFLQDGERYNVDHPQLLWDLGWFIGQKIGRADERKQYRKLFREDEKFHPADRSIEERDNWLVGKKWYERAVEVVDNRVRGYTMGRKSPRDFYSAPAKSQMNYAEAIEEEGAFEKARRAWILAAAEWRLFGQAPIEHSLSGDKLLLGSEPQLDKELTAQRAKLDALHPGVREKMIEEKRQSLTQEERDVLDTPQEKLTPQQAEQRYMADMKVQLTDREVAERIASEVPAQKKQSLQLANELEEKQRVLEYTRNYKRDANYDYWQTRADFEQTTNALAAREAMYNAKRAADSADLQRSKRLYQEGFAKWRLVLDEFPAMLEEDSPNGDDLLDYVKEYRDVLDQLDETLDDDFPMWKLIEDFDREQAFAEELAERRKRQGQPAESQATAPAATETPEQETPTDSPDAPAESQAPPEGSTETPAATEEPNTPPVP